MTDHSLTVKPTTALHPGAFDFLRSLGGDHLVREIVAIFLRDTPKAVQAALRANSAGDLRALRNAVHSFKSSAVSLGALDLHQLAAAIEQRAAEHQADTIGALVNELPGVFARVKQQLEAVALALPT